MSQRNLRGLLPFLALLAGILSAVGGQAAPQGSGCTTAACHAKLLQRKDVHPVTDSCDNCHSAAATPHPQAGVKTFNLVQEVPGLCLTCHDTIGKKADVHPPVKAGECPTCHDPHASDEAKLLKSPVKNLCESCHSDKASFKVLHGPVASGECGACHTPHDSEVKPLLKKESAKLCFDCHRDIEDVMKKKDVHPAMDAGCTGCHNPHGSAHPKLLADEGQTLCFQCHDSIADTVRKATVPHAALTGKNGCVACHAPHAGDIEKLLVAPQKEICLGCHENVVTKDMTVLHGPVKDGNCTACHAPHGGQYPKLLVQAFPQELYVPYSDTEFALCFNCHNRDLVQYPDTSYATNFRDGERNLHYLHVHKEKGRSCKLCHKAHGSAGPRLIAESVAFGNWSLVLKFRKTETGGTCSPGCHTPASYDRKQPAKRAEAEPVPAPGRTAAAEPTATPPRETPVPAPTPGPRPTPVVSATPKPAPVEDATPQLLPASGYQYMKQGDLQQAANAFRDALLKEPAQRYTIQLELVCRAESVAAGLREASQSAGYFILPSPYKGRPCYTACWGLFDSKRQAANALSTVPAFFRGQSGSVPVIAPIRSLLR